MPHNFLRLATALQEAPQTQQRGQHQPYKVDSRYTSQTSCPPVANQTTQSVSYSQGAVNCYDDRTLLTGTFHSFTQPRPLQQQPQPHFLHGLLDSIYTVSGQKPPDINPRTKTTWTKTPLAKPPPEKTYEHKIYFT